MKGSERVPVPELEVERFLHWVQSGAQPFIELQGRQLQPVRTIQDLDAVISQAHSRGCKWMLLDGPKPVRQYWILDPWWEDEPEMTERLQRATQARCVNLRLLYEAIAAATPPATPAATEHVARDI
jgi:hypothetical protein